MSTEAYEVEEVVHVESPIPEASFRVVSVQPERFPNDMDARIHVEWVGKDQNPCIVHGSKQFLVAPGSVVGNTFRITRTSWSMLQWVVVDSDGIGRAHIGSVGAWALVVDVSAEPCELSRDPEHAFCETMAARWERISKATLLESRVESAADLMRRLPDGDRVILCEQFLNDTPVSAEELPVKNELCRLAGQELLRIIKKPRI